MRIDDYLSTVGLIKRRTIAKEMADNGLVEVNGRKVKPSYEVKLGDIIVIKGSQPFTAEVLSGAARLGGQRCPRRLLSARSELHYLPSDLTAPLFLRGTSNQLAALPVSIDGLLIVAA